MIKIFSINKVIYLINNQVAFKHNASNVLVNIQSAEEMALAYNKFANNINLNEIYFFNENLSHLYNYFADMFRVIEAAGGLVKNINGEFLFIFRNGKWDLPKGKIEKCESIKNAAIREVEEECGISGLSIIRELPPTYHTYFMEEKAVLKRTYWFEMLCNDSAPLVPQLEEGITDAQWVAKKNRGNVLKNTFESIKEVLKYDTLS